MIKSSRTSIVCNRYNFESEEDNTDQKEKRLTKKLATLIKLTGEIADDLKRSNLERKVEKNAELKDLMNDILLLQDKQRQTEDSLLTLLNDLDMDMADAELVYENPDDEFEQFDNLMAGIADVVKESEDAIKANASEQLLKSIASVMKKKVMQLEEEQVNTILNNLSVGLLIARNNIADNNIVLDPALLDFKIKIDAGQIPKSILVDYEDTLACFTQKNEFLLVKGSFGYQILKGKKGFHNQEDMLCDYNDVCFMNRRFYIFCEDSKSIRMQMVARQPPQVVYSFKDAEREGKLASTLFPALDGGLLVLRTNNMTLQLLGIDSETGLLNGKDGQIKFGNVEAMVVFGSINDHLAVVCLEGMNTYLKIYRIFSGVGGYTSKEVCSCLIGKKTSKDITYNLTVCPSSRIIAINTHNPDLPDNLSSQINLTFLEFIDNRVNILTEHEQDIEKGVGEFRALSFLNYYHNILVLTAIDYTDKSRIFTFLFDRDTKSIFEKQGLRATSGVGKVARIENFGQSRFRGSDNQARIFEISYRLSGDECLEVI